MLSAGRVSELKQQGALEAARDPNSGVTAEEAERVVVAESRRAGGQAFQFDADATPEQKAAQVANAIPPGLKTALKPKAAALVTDQDKGPPQYDLPPPTRAGAVAAPHDDSDDEFHDPEDADWERVGWKPRFGALPGDFDADETTQDTPTWLEGKLDDKFFGEWYFNTGIIIFACLSSWVIAVLGGGLGWVFLVIATCGTYYRTSIRRVRRNYRDDINRELAKARLETDTETLEWINSFLVKFWPIYAPVLCKTIVSSVDQVLSTATPAFLDSLRLRTFTLGTKPPRLEHVKTYPKSEDDIVLMDWRFSFTPNDTSDMTARQIKVKQNPKVVLEVRVGKGIVSKGLDVIVEDMACSGIMRVRLKLQLPFPHIDRVELCFLERPVIDYVCKPLGGDMFGLDTNFIPGLSGFIMEQIHANLGPMMYDPNVFPIEIAKMLAGTPVDQAIGVLQIQFHGGQGLGAPGGGTPDPYALVTINGRQELARTKTIKQNANPSWNETINIVINSLKDSLEINVFDFNEFRKDRDLGKAIFPLERLEQIDEIENETLEVLSNGKARGVIHADVRFFPVLGESKLEDGTSVPPPESISGIARFTVEQAKDLDGTKSLIGQLNPYAVLLLNGKEVHTSGKLKRTNNPIWVDAHKEMLITDRKTAKLGLVIKDDRDLAGDPIIGTYQIKLDDMLDLTMKGQEWYNLANVKTGRAKMMLQWKPVALKGALAGGGYITPIGVMRLHFKNARDLRNLETVGKSDPYMRVLVSGVQKARTVTFKNNLNPDWDEVVYVAVHSTREKLTIECMDEETAHRDRSLGHFEIPVAEYAHQDENGEWEVTDSKKAISQKLTYGRANQTKGTLNYTCSFFPTVPVVDPEDEEREREEREAGLVTSANGRPTSAANSVISINNGTPTHGPDRSAESPKIGSQRVRSNTSGTISSLRGKDASGDLALKPSQGEKDQEESGTDKREPAKIKLSPENLMDYGAYMSRVLSLSPEYFKSGLLVFKIIEGELAQSHCHLEVVIDDYAFPAYSSSKVNSRHHVFNETGEAMIRELDQSRITMRLVEHIEKEGKGSEDRAIARLTGNTLQTLQRCLYTPTQLTLHDEKGHESKITISLKFLPVKMKLDLSESFNNMGKLRVDVLDASDLPAADRNGYSDPYCKFILNDKEVHKTEKQKKTLNPTWNESFETMVRSRTAAKFICEVYDWDIGPDKDDFLGRADINLGILDPFQRKEIILTLDGKSGTVRLRLLFTPEFVTRIRQGTSTFQGTFAAPVKIVGAPVKGVQGIAKVGGSFIGKPFRKRTKSGRDQELTPENEEVDFRPSTSEGSSIPGVPVVSVEDSSTGSMGHSHTKSWGAASMADSTFGNSATGTNSPHHTGEQGTADIAVIAASGFPASSNLRFLLSMQTHKGSKELHKTKGQKATENAELVFSEKDESVKVPCAADTAFKIVAITDHRLRSDEILGEGTFFVSDQGSTIGGEHPVKVGNGTVMIRSRFIAADSVSTLSAGGIGAPSSSGGTPSKAGGARLSRAFHRKDRGVSPAAS